MAKYIYDLDGFMLQTGFLFGVQKISLDGKPAKTIRFVHTDDSFQGGKNPYTFVYFMICEGVWDRRKFFRNQAPTFFDRLYRTTLKRIFAGHSVVRATSFELEEDRRRKSGVSMSGAPRDRSANMQNMVDTFCSEYRLRKQSKKEGVYNNGDCFNMTSPCNYGKTQDGILNYVKPSFKGTKIEKANTMQQTGNWTNGKNEKGERVDLHHMQSQSEYFGKGKIV